MSPEYFYISNTKIQSINRKEDFLQIIQNKTVDIKNSLKANKETLENLEEQLNNEKSQLEELEKINLSNYKTISSLEIGEFHFNEQIELPPYSFLILNK